jgi:hypothetical protein
LQISQGYIIRILQHFATKLWSITNFVMLFHAMMEFFKQLNIPTAMCQVKSQYKQVQVALKF